MSIDENELLKRATPIYLSKAIVAFNDSSFRVVEKSVIYEPNEDEINVLRNFLKVVGLNEYHSYEQMYEVFSLYVEELKKSEFIGEWGNYDLKAVSENAGAMVRFRSFYLTSKGLDIYHKVQAHEDSERRHKDNQWSTKVSTRIAFSAVAISILSTITTFTISSFNIKNQNLRLEQAREQLEISNKQLELANKRFGLLQQQVENSTTKEKK